MTDISLYDAGGVANHRHGWYKIVKAADQAVTNSTTLTDDTDLQFTTTANTKYLIRLHVFWNTSNSGADYQYWVKHDGTTSFVRRKITYGIAAGAPEEKALGTAFAGAATAITTTVAGDNIVEEIITLSVGASGGLFHIQFAQASAVAANSATHYAGSSLEYCVLA